MKNTQIIQLAILPVMMLSGCDDSPKPKTYNTSSAVTQKADGSYQKCNPNEQSCQSGSSAGGGVSGASNASDDPDRTNARHSDSHSTHANSRRVPYWGSGGGVSRSGFGGSSGRSGG